MAEARAALLVVGADPVIAGRLQSALDRDGLRVRFAPTAAEGLERLANEVAPVVIVCERLDDGAAAEFVGRIRNLAPLTQVLVVLDDESPHGPPAMMVREWGLHGVHYRTDPIDRLVVAVAAALETHEQLTQLHATERIKTELLADVSHEFRTPLNVILGYLDLLREGAFGALPDEVHTVHDKLLGNASFLLEIVEEFLDLARVESTATPRRHDAIDLRPMLNDLGESFALLLDGRPIAFRAVVPSNLPQVLGDPAKLRVIIQNLLTNAAKFTREGSIALVADADVDGWIAVHVSDTGPGIPEHEQARIFDLFHQAGTASDRAKGIGLGLALARRFAAAMGGALQVASEVGTGTTFTLRIPSARRLVVA